MKDILSSIVLGHLPDCSALPKAFSIQMGQLGIFDRLRILLLMSLEIPLTQTSSFGRIVLEFVS